MTSKAFAVSSATASRIFLEDCLMDFLNRFTTMTMTRAGGVTSKASLAFTKNSRLIAPATMTAFETKSATLSVRTLSTSFVSLTTREMSSPDRDVSRKLMGIRSMFSYKSDRSL